MIFNAHIVLKDTIKDALTFLIVSKDDDDKISEFINKNESKETAIKVNFLIACSHSWFNSLTTWLKSKSFFECVDLNIGLLCACESGSAELASLLLDYGADPDTYYEQLSPLVVAAIFGNIDVIRLLLESCFIFESTKFLALDYAFKNGQLGSIDILESLMYD